MSSDCKSDDGTHPALLDLQNHLSVESNQRMALPVAAIKTLLGVIQRSNSNTMMGLQEELRQASEVMLHWASSNTSLINRSTIALSSGCELFLK